MSIEYYDKNANLFIENTISANMEILYNKFENYIKLNGKILDLGCGSGRDTKYFLNKGYDVTSVDGSIEMIKYCKTHLCNEIVFSTFQDYEPISKFDAIWACASLLHVERDDLDGIISKYVNVLNEDGIFFMSFKNRKSDYEKDGRTFTCFDDKKLKELLSKLSSIELIETIGTTDVRKNRDDEVWISVILKKV